jgi:tetratricopeptide (TPR) repeat protein/predicted aspartyl protease
MHRSMIAAVAGLALAAVAQPAAAACQFVQLAELPVTMQGLRATIKVKINGHDSTLVVDTGAFFNTISTQGAADYAMTPVATPFGMRVRGVGGGEKDAKAVRAATFDFAGAPFKNFDFLVADRVGGGGIDGLLGENILGNFEVEYDLANGFIRLFKAMDCGFNTNLAYWSAGKALSQLPLITGDPGNHGSVERIPGPKAYLKDLVTAAKVDGHSIKVVFDTGTPLSVLSRPAAARAGVKPSTEGVVPAGVDFGLFGGGMQTYIAPFDSFAIGDEEVQHTRLRIADIELSKGDMLLGADFFLSHRILISNSQHRLYFTYNGGPVFKLDREAGIQTARAPASASPVATPATAPAATASADAGDLKTAADYARRAAAAAARRDFPAAVADDTHAIALDPKDPATYVARATARFEIRQGLAALNDLNDALKLKPDYAPALLLRGEATLGVDKPHALADLEAAMKLSPGDRTMPLTVASAYVRAEEYPRGIALLDAWLADHPKDEDRPGVLAERCNARATWGQENERALTDCDAAVKVVGRSAGVLENRGVVLLRLGRLDEAISQFDAAIKIDPKAPWALYGRGLAKQKRGDKAAGDADIAAAVAVRPNLPQLAKRYGLAG